MENMSQGGSDLRHGALGIVEKLWSNARSEIASDDAAASQLTISEHSRSVTPCQREMGVGRPPAKAPFPGMSAPSSRVSPGSPEQSIRGPVKHDDPISRVAIECWRATFRRLGATQPCRR